MNKISSVIVTYNRKEQLLDCLYAVCRQSVLPSSIIIVDNASTDGTKRSLLEKNIITSGRLMVNDSFEHYIGRVEGVLLNYLYLSQNSGGAGGFYTGMKYAYEQGSDFCWLMDDDGVPHKNQLETLISSSLATGIDFLNALVVDINEPQVLAFSLGGKTERSELAHLKYVDNLVNPFNGTLITRRLMDTIGFVKKEMFIWGDEREYTLRARLNGFKLVTVVSATHLHPKMKGIRVNAIPFMSNSSIVLKPAHMAHFYFRNLGFIESRYAKRHVRYSTIILYVVYFLRTLAFKDLGIFINSYLQGVKNDFTASKM